MNAATQPSPMLAEQARQWLAYRHDRPCALAALWRAESWRSSTDQSAPMRQALALNLILHRCDLPVFPGELLVGLGQVCAAGPAGSLSPAAQAEAEAFLLASGASGAWRSSSAFLPDLELLLQEGFGGLRRRVRRAMRHHDDPARLAQLQAMEVALSGVSEWWQRWAARLALAAREYPAQAERLNRQAASHLALAEKAPKTFGEGLQLVYSLLCLAQLEGFRGLPLGRLDQVLFPLYAADLRAHRLTPDEAQSWLNELASRLAANGDLHDVTLGGCTVETGVEASNDLTLMILRAARAAGVPGLNPVLRSQPGGPPEALGLLALCAQEQALYPALLNDATQIPALLAAGVSVELARDYASVGAPGIGLAGYSGPWSQGQINLAKAVNLVLFNGIDPLSGMRHGPATGEPANFAEFQAAFLAQVRHLASSEISRLRQGLPGQSSPLMSALVRDCILRGRDLHQGGAYRPGGQELWVTGLGTALRCLGLVQQWVYELPRFTLHRLRALVNSNFVGALSEGAELLASAQELHRLPEWLAKLESELVTELGALASQLSDATHGQCLILPSAQAHNHLAGTTTGATLDGRLAREALHDVLPSERQVRLGPQECRRLVPSGPPGAHAIMLHPRPAHLKAGADPAPLLRLLNDCLKGQGLALHFGPCRRRLRELGGENAVNGTRFRPCALLLQAP